MNTVVLLAALTAAAPALKEKPKPPVDVAGEWAVEGITVNGRDSKVAGNLVYAFTKEGKWHILRDGQETSTTLQRGYEMDAKAAQPTIDLITNTAAPAGARLRGIFKIEGDTLTICGTRTQGADRPTTFEAPEGSGNTKYVLKRVKK